jgi:hypothetical protein
MYENVFSALVELYQRNLEAKIIILDYFNLPSLSWSNSTLPINCYLHIDSYFISMLPYFNLNQFNYVRNYNNVTLDLVLSNIYACVSNDPDPLLSIDEHYPPINVSLYYNQFNIPPVSKSFYDFKNCNYLNIIKYLGDSFSNHDFNSSDVNILTNIQPFIKQYIYLSQ